MDNGRPPRMGDLFTTGTHMMRADDGTIGRPVVVEGPHGSTSVHIVKVNDRDQDAIDRRALAAKARYLVEFKDKTSDAYMSVKLGVLDVEDPDELIAFLVQHEMAEPSVEIEAKLRDTAPWKDGHYQSLEEAWYGDIANGELGLMYLWKNGAEQSEDPVVQAENDRRYEEADRVWKEIEAFQNQLNELLVEKRDELRDNYYGVADEDDDDPVAMTMAELQDRVCEIAGETRAETIFYQEKLRQRSYYSTRRVDDWRTRYFDTLDEYDALPDRIKVQLFKAYDEMSVSDLAGKGSPGTPGSSPSSDPSDEAAPSHPSGLVDASASRTSPTSS